jgi:MFS family permease
MGFVLSGTQMGPGFGPFFGGLIITFQSWRVIFWLQSAVAALGVVFVVLFLPETMRHRRLEDIRIAKGKNVNWVWINPLRPIVLFKYPNLLFTVVPL